MHLAGFKYAGVSVQRPLHTYEQNVTGTVSVLRGDGRTPASAAWCSPPAPRPTARPTCDLVTERDRRRARSRRTASRKLIGEWLLRDQGVATGPRHTSLRYFNVVGSGSPDLYDTSPHNLFPLVIEALIEGRTPRINGVDYPTPDGTCVRDYVHVADLAALARGRGPRPRRGRPLEPVYNLGSGEGVSVRQIMDAMARVTGIDFEPEVATAARRATPPASSRPASWPPATSTGGCGTPSTRWSAARGRPAQAPVGERPMTVLDLFRLDGKVAVVTGASSGLGVSFAQALAEAGADVVLAARRVDRLEETRALVEATGRRALDGADRRRRPRCLPGPGRRGGRGSSARSTCWSTTPASGTAVPATRETPEQFRQVVDVNLNGCYWMAQACGRVMQPGSSIVNISSVLGPHHRRAAAGGVLRDQGRR